MMNYKHILIDMDYCADPLWATAADEGIFPNASLKEFEKVLPRSVLHSLVVYQNLWESTYWSKYIGPSEEDRKFPGDDIVYDLLRDMPPILAAKIKQALPGCHVYYRCPETMDPIEVGTVSKNVIQPTVVG